MKLLRLFFFLQLLIIYPSISFGQEKTDTMKVAAGLSAEDIDQLKNPISASSDLNVGGLSSVQPSSSLAHDLPVRPDLEPPMPISWYNFSPMRRGDYLPYWSTGYMYGAHGMFGDRINGYSSFASMGVVQNLGEYFTVKAGMTVGKSLFYNTADFSSTVNWHPSRFFELTAFGSYMPGSFMSQMQGISSFEWGGYATFKTDTDVPFGIDLGARDYYDSYSGHYVTPIIQPFVKIGESKLGLDFGPLLQDWINKDKRGWGGGRGMNPIPQPIKAIPQVAPRR